jgi:hypothetical protein
MSGQRVKSGADSTFDANVTAGFRLPLASAPEYHSGGAIPPAAVTLERLRLMRPSLAGVGRLP